MSSAPSIPASDLLRCVHCGYDLRGLAENRCPECGHDFDPTRLRTAPLPWLLEADTRWSAYWLTAWHVIARPWKLGQLVQLPVTVDSIRARQFRRWTVRLALASTALAVVLLAQMITREPMLVVFALILIILFVWPFLELATAVDPRSSPTTLDPQQAATYTYLYTFCSAPLALSPLIPVIVLYLGLLTLPPSQIVFLAFVACLPFLFAWWLSQIIFHAAATRGLVGDALTAGIVVLLQWIAIGVMCAALCGVIIFVLSSMLNP